MNKFTHFFEDYLFILFIGFVMGVLFILKGYEKITINTKAAHIRYVVNGVLGSMFITWLGFEIFIFIGLPDKLSVALGGLLAYLCADKIAEMFEIFLQRKLNAKRNFDENVK